MLVKVVSSFRYVLGACPRVRFALWTTLLCLSGSRAVLGQLQLNPTTTPYPLSNSPAGSYQPLPQPAPASVGTPGRTSPTGVISGQVNASGGLEAPNRRNNPVLDPRLRIVNLAPEQPTEFQQLVFDSLGAQLPIFGANLFTDVPSTFAPIDDIPLSPDYVIGPGDELQVQVYGQVNQQGAFQVNRAGNIQYPDVGTIHVAGVRYQELQAFLKTQLARVYRHFDLSVNLGELRSIQVFVVGAARQPGAYTISSLSTLLNALFASGGPQARGSLRDIQVLRSGANVVHFDLYDLLLHGDKSKDIPLVAGDVIFIPPVGPQAAIGGSVNNPAIYELQPGMTAKQLLQLAGGQTSIALGTHIRIERITGHTARSIVDVELTQGKDTPLADGDIVRVDPIVDQYEDAVTLRGNVTTPGRYVWHPGLRITDVVTNKDQLITREYYRRRNALGTQTPFQNPLNAKLPTSPLYRPPFGSNPNPDVLYPNQPCGSTPGQAGASASSPNGCVPVAASATGGTANAAISPASTAATAATAGGASSAAPQDTADLQRNAGTNGGGSVGSALIASSSSFQPVNDVVLSAPDLDWNYAVVERLDHESLTTQLLPFNPGKLFLKNDPSQNLELQAGDVVTFFSTADLKVPTAEQTRFVRLEGEFVASGVYSVEPGETLRHLLARAGGLSQDAYLFGSEFTRQSTRRVQKQRLSEFADTLEAQVSAQTANAASRAVSPADAVAAAAAAVDARESVARLRRVVPLGRIVLDLKPDSRDLDSVPDIQLEDGDRFVVPRVPTTVAVEGQVYSANAFVYVPRRRERDYLRQAGGPDREADRKRSFILRADGSVYSNQYGKVDRATIFPGDTIVIPPQINRQAILRNLLDFSTLLSQFGIGVAAINLLR